MSDIEWAPEHSDGIEWEPSRKRGWGNDVVDEMPRRLRAAGGGIEAAVDIVGGIPSFIGGGFLGVMDPRHGGDLDKMNQQIQQYQKAIPRPEPFTDTGKEAMEAIAAAREYSGSFGKDSPALTTANETAFDIATMTLPLKFRGQPRGLSPEGLLAKEKYLNERKGPPSPKPDVEWASVEPRDTGFRRRQGDAEQITQVANPNQGELPIESGFKAGEGPLPYKPTEMPLVRKDLTQPDLFDPLPPSMKAPGENRVSPPQNRTDLLQDEFKTGSQDYEAALNRYKETQHPDDLNDAQTAAAQVQRASNNLANFRAETESGVPFYTGKRAHRQGGSVDLSGINFGGLKELPDRLKEWIATLAGSQASDRLTKEGYTNHAGKDELALHDEYTKENLANPDFVKQAIAQSAGYTSGRVGPGFEFGTKGWIGKQRGGLNLNAFKQDPEFLKFKDSLPEPLKKEAKAIWKEIQKDLKTPTQTNVVVNEPANKVVSAIPGLKTWKDEIGPLPEKADDMLPVFRTEKDLGGDKMARAGQQLVSGAGLLGFGSQNTLVRWIYQNVNRIMRESAHKIDQRILNKDTGFKSLMEKLTDQEFAKVWYELAIREGKEDLTREKMFDLGFNEKQVDAADAYRKADEATLRDLNEGRAMKGKKPVERRLGHIAARFRGDWVFNINDKDGNLISREGAATEREATKLKEWYKEKHPEYTIGETTYSGMHRFGDASNANVGYQELMSVLENDDPRVEALASTYQDYVQQKAYDVLSVKKHFLAKSGVLGAEGFKEWKSVLENAHEGLRSVMNYMDHAIKWSEFQKVSPEIGKVFKDQETRDNQPNALRYSQAYIDQAFGRSFPIARHIDALFDAFFKNTGLSSSLALHNVRQMKRFLTADFLGFWNLGFSFSQIVQVIQTTPAWGQYLKDAGAHASFLNSFWKGSYDGMIAMSLGEHRMTSLGREAMAWAHKYGIVEPKLLQDIQTLTDLPTGKLYDWIAFKSMTYPEKIARTQVYLNWAHFLDHANEFSNKEHLFEAAANLTDFTMVNYHSHERAFLYKQAGLLGETANALTTFKHNLFSQAWALNERSREHGQNIKTLQRLPNTFDNEGNLLPPSAPILKQLEFEKQAASRKWLLAFGGMSLALGGLLGTAGREDVDSVIKMLNKLSVSGNYGIPRIPSTREIFMKAPDLVSFGPVSAITGLDLSGKFSIANVIPDTPLQAVNPFLGTIGKATEDSMDVLGNPTITQVMRGLTQFAPSGPLKWSGEQYFTDKKGQFLDPRTMEGKFDRSKRAGGLFGMLGFNGNDARMLGLRTLDESHAMNKFRNIKDQDMWMAQQRKQTIENAIDKFYEHRNISKNAEDYVLKYEGKIEDLVGRIRDNAKAQNMTADMRLQLKSLENAMRAERLQEMK